MVIHPWPCVCMCLCVCIGVHVCVCVYIGLYLYVSVSLYVHVFDVALQVWFFQTSHYDTIYLSADTRWIPFTLRCMRSEAGKTLAGNGQCWWLEHTPQEPAQGVCRAVFRLASPSCREVCVCYISLRQLLLLFLGVASFVAFAFVVDFSDDVFVGVIRQCWEESSRVLKGIVLVIRDIILCILWKPEER